VTANTSISWTTAARAFSGGDEQPPEPAVPRGQSYGERSLVWADRPVQGQLPDGRGIDLDLDRGGLNTDERERTELGEHYDRLRPTTT
jgi:hypothetical protein